MRAYYLFIILLLTLVHGCTNLPVPSDNWHDAMEAGRWHAQGKIGLIYNTKGQSANFDWENNSDNYTIALHGPLGQGRVQLSKQQSIYSVKDKSGEHTAPSAEALLQQQLGWSLPVGGLQYWMRGTINPNAAVDAQQRDLAGRLSQLEQQGWQITYKDYYDNEGQTSLPKKIIARRESIKLTVLIKKWSLLKTHSIAF